MAKSARAAAAAAGTRGREHRTDSHERDKSGRGSWCEHNGAEALELALAQLGHFGLYQRYMLLMLCLPNLLAAMYSLNYVFVADQVPFR